VISLVDPVQELALISKSSKTEQYKGKHINIELNLPSSFSSLFWLQSAKQ